MVGVIEFKIQNGTDRERMVLALANSGYKVVVSKRKHPTLYLQNDYFVQVEIPFTEEGQNSMENCDVCQELIFYFDKCYMRIENSNWDAHNDCMNYEDIEINYCYQCGKKYE